jgi:hypothetical protein
MRRKPAKKIKPTIKIVVSGEKRKNTTRLKERLIKAKVDKG